MNMFKAKGDISVTLGKKNQLVIELPDDLSDADLIRAIRLHGKKGLMVQVGDPQMAMEDYGVSITRLGISATIAPNGVVEGVKKPEEEDQGDILVGSEEREEVSEFPTCPKCSLILNEGEGCPHCKESGDFESMDFDDDAEGDTESSESDQETGEDEHEETGSDQSEADKIPKKAVEDFILEKRPAFDDIPFDFPTLLERKRESKESWLEIARDLGENSGVMQSAFLKYKKRVKEQMFWVV